VDNGDPRGPQNVNTLFPRRRRLSPRLSVVTLILSGIICAWFLLALLQEFQSFFGIGHVCQKCTCTPENPREHRHPKPRHGDRIWTVNPGIGRVYPSENR